MDFLFNGKFWLSAVFIAVLLGFASQLRADDRPWLSYLINPSFWFSGAVDEDKSDSYYYSYDKQQIRYSPMGNWFELGNTLIEGADVETFEVLARDFAKDKNNIYYQSDVITRSVDYMTFSLINELIARDKNHVYVPSRFVAESALAEQSDSPLHIISDANPANFEIINDAWTKDDKQAYYYFVPQAVDVASLALLNEYIVKDAHAVFIKHDDRFIKTQVAGLHVNALNERFIYDEHKLYWFDASYQQNDNGDSQSRVWLESVAYQNIDSFTQFNDDYFTLDDSVYFGKNRVAQADAKTFQIINNAGFAKDASQVFYQQHRLPNADAHSYALLLEHGSYGRDNSRIYYKNQLLGEKKTPLKVLSNDDYLVSGDKVFFQGKVIEGANADYFTLLERFASYASDGNAVYFQDKRIEGVDLNTVVVINRDMAIRDANFVYWHGSRVEGADVNTFMRSHRNYEKYDAEDKRYFYKNGIRVATRND